MSDPLDDAVDAVTETFPHLFDSKEKCREVLGVAFDAVRERMNERIIAVAATAFARNESIIDIAPQTYVEAVIGEATKP